MKAGTRLKSAVCDTEIIVVRIAAVEIMIECGGVPMGDAHQDRSGAGIHPGFDGGTTLGKRYSDDPAGVLVLCTAGGAGALSVDGRLLQQVVTKQMPASD